MQLVNTYRPHLAATIFPKKLKKKNQTADMWLFALTAVAVVHKDGGCTTDLDCSLNGVCGDTKTCVCDVPWKGERCQTLDLQPGEVGLHDIPLCTYHGDGPNSTSWGGSVLHAPEDGKYYMWAASMVNNCTSHPPFTVSLSLLRTSC